MKFKRSMAVLMVCSTLIILTATSAHALARDETSAVVLLRDSMAMLTGLVIFLALSGLLVMTCVILYRRLAGSSVATVGHVPDGGQIDFSNIETPKEFRTPSAGSKRGTAVDAELIDAIILSILTPKNKENAMSTTDFSRPQGVGTLDDEWFDATEIEEPLERPSMEFTDDMIQRVLAEIELQRQAEHAGQQQLEQQRAEQLRVEQQRAERQLAERQQQLRAEQQRAEQRLVERQQQLRAEQQRAEQLRVEQQSAERQLAERQQQLRIEQQCAEQQLVERQQQLRSLRQQRWEQQQQQQQQLQHWEQQLRTVRQRKWGQPQEQQEPQGQQGLQEQQMQQEAPWQLSRRKQGKHFKPAFLDAQGGEMKTGAAVRQSAYVMKHSRDQAEVVYQRVG